MKTVLVIGLRGKTGRQVATALMRRNGVAVRGAGRNVADLNFPGVVVSHFDWEDSASWPGALAGVEAIYLVKPKTADPAGTVASILRLAVSIERVVLLSEVDASNRDEATDERKVERVIESSPIAWTILRPNWFMQNFTEPSFYLEAIRDAGELKVPTGGQPTSFVDTRDIADVSTAALLDSGHAGRSYTLTGPQALTFAEVAGLVGQAAGHEVRYIDPPLNEYLEALADKGTAKATVEYYRQIYACIQEGRTSIISADVEQVTGHPPRAFSAFVEENKSVWRRASARH
ncbi:NmrA family NAD(P)-binding protein [Bradyrhizobium sp. RDT10]